MLVAQSFYALLKILDQDCSLGFRDSQSVREMQLVLVQCLIRLLQRQETDGSWGKIGKREETAYAILASSALLAIDWLAPFKSELESAILHGHQYLRAHSHDLAPEKLWIEKVTYGSEILARAYRLAALRKKAKDLVRCGLRWPNIVDRQSSEPTPKDLVLKQIPILKRCPTWLFDASRIEAGIFLVRLQGLHDHVFLREGFTEDKYFEWIPNIWTLANNISEAHRSSRFLLNMMTISFINFQVDEFMESVVASLSADALDVVKVFIVAQLDIQSCSGTANKTSRSQDYGEDHQPHKKLKGETHVNGHGSTLEHVIKVLGRYIDYVVVHPDLQNAGAGDQRLLRHELRKFLLAHLAQIKGNWTLHEQRQKQTTVNQPVLLEQPHQSFCEWVRGMASDHTSCPYSFVLACCWSSSGEQDLFKTAWQKYVADDICHRLATMCRVYNDFGSLERDVKEDNLNCANFPEFWSDMLPREEKAGQLERRVFEIADYERTMLETSLSQLERCSERPVSAMLSVFILVTDMFGQIYVVRDLASRRQQ